MTSHVTDTVIDGALTDQRAALHRDLSRAPLRLVAAVPDALQLLLQLLHLPAELAHSGLQLLLQLPGFPLQHVLQLLHLGPQSLVLLEQLRERFADLSHQALFYLPDVAQRRLFPRRVWRFFRPESPEDGNGRLDGDFHNGRHFAAEPRLHVASVGR